MELAQKTKLDLEIEQLYDRLHQLDFEQARREGFEEGRRRGIKEVIEYLEHQIQWRLEMRDIWEGTRMKRNYTREVNNIRKVIEMIKQAFEGRLKA